MPNTFRFEYNILGAGKWRQREEKKNDIIQMLVNGYECVWRMKNINYFIRSGGERKKNKHYKNLHTKPKERNKELIPDHMAILTAIATAIHTI